MSGYVYPWEHPAVAGKHVITMTRDYPAGDTISVATCSCGWSHRLALKPGANEREIYGAQDEAIEAHWQQAIDQHEAAA